MNRDRVSDRVSDRDSVEVSVWDRICWDTLKDRIWLRVE